MQNKKKSGPAEFWRSRGACCLTHAGVSARRRSCTLAVRHRSAVSAVQQLYQYQQYQNKNGHHKNGAHQHNHHGIRAVISAGERRTGGLCGSGHMSGGCENVCMADSPFSQSHPCSSRCRVILAPFLALCKSEARKRKKIGYAHKTNQHSREACCRF